MDPNISPAVSDHAPSPTKHTSKKTILVAVFCVISILIVFASTVFLAKKYSPIPDQAITKNVCGNPASATPEEQALLDVWKNRLRDIDQEIPVFMNSSNESDSARAIELSSEADILLASSTALSVAIDKREIEAIPPQAIDDILKEYCLDSSNSLWLSRLENHRYASSSEIYSTMTASELVCRLSAHNFADESVASALYYLGLKEVRADNQSVAIQLYTCAAKNYFDINSMYRLAMVHYVGSENIGLQLPPDQIIYPDKKQSYFWVVARLRTAAEEGRDYHVLEDSFDEKTISLLDTLQQDNTLTDNDLLSIEQSVVDFVATRFPRIHDEQWLVYNHSMRAILPALEKAAEN